MKYYTYMLRCADGSIYTGIAADLEKRLKAHLKKGASGAKYTRAHEAVRFERAWASDDRGTASKLEYRIKRLSKKEKEELISSPEKFMCIFSDKLDCNLYELVV